MAEGRPVGTMFAELDLDLTRFERNMKRAYELTTNGTQKFEDKFRQLGIRSDRYYESQRQLARKTYDAIVADARATAKDRLNARKALHDRIAYFNREETVGYKTMFNQQKEGWASVTRAVLRYYAAFYVVTNGIRNVINITRELYGASARAAQIGKAYSEIAGSAELAAKEMGFLRDVSDALGQNFWELQGSYKNLLAASKGTNLEGRKTRDIFEAVTKASATLGLASDKTKLSLYAIEQMISKGVVSSEELRRQLGDNLPGAFATAAKAMNMSTQELLANLKAGKVLTEDFIPKFAAALEEKYSGEVVKSVAATNKFKEAIEDLKVEIGKGEFLEGMTKALQEITNLLKDEGVVSDLKSLADAIGSVTEASIKLYNVLKKFDDMKPDWLEKALSFLGPLSGGNTAKDIILGLSNAANEISDSFDKDTIDEITATEEAIAKLQHRIESGFRVYMWEKSTAQLKKDLEILKAKLFELNLERYSTATPLGPGGGTNKSMPSGILDLDLEEFKSSVIEGVNTVQTLTDWLDELETSLYDVTVGAGEFSDAVDNWSKGISGQFEMLKIDKPTIDLANPTITLDGGKTINQILAEGFDTSTDFANVTYKSGGAFAGPIMDLTFIGHYEKDQASEDYDGFLETIRDRTTDTFSDIMTGQKDIWSSTFDWIGDYVGQTLSKKISDALGGNFFSGLLGGIAGGLVGGAISMIGKLFSGGGGYKHTWNQASPTSLFSDVGSWSYSGGSEDLRNSLNDMIGNTTDTILGFVEVLSDSAQDTVMTQLQKTQVIFDSLQSVELSSGNEEQQIKTYVNRARYDFLESVTQPIVEGFAKEIYSSGGLGLLSDRLLRTFQSSGVFNVGTPRAQAWTIGTATLEDYIDTASNLVTVLNNLDDVWTSSETQIERYIATVTGTATDLDKALWGVNDMFEGWKKSFLDAGGGEDTEEFLWMMDQWQVAIDATTDSFKEVIDTTEEAAEVIAKFGDTLEDRITVQSLQNKILGLNSNEIRMAEIATRYGWSNTASMAGGTYNWGQIASNLSMYGQMSGADLTDYINKVAEKFGVSIDTVIDDFGYLSDTIWDFANEAKSAAQDMADAWGNINQSISAQLHDISYGSSSPLSAETRLAQLVSEINDFMGHQSVGVFLGGLANEPERIAAVQKLREYYTTRLELTQEAYDRPSVEYQSRLTKIMNDLGTLESYSAYGQDQAEQYLSSISGSMQDVYDEISIQTYYLHDIAYNIGAGLQAILLTSQGRNIGFSPKYPNYDTGAYIDYDQTANLHRGEFVMTPAQLREAGKMIGDTTVNLTINAPGGDKDEIEKTIMRILPYALENGKGRASIQKVVRTS